MSYRFKVERGWTYVHDGKHNWANPDVFHVNAETEKDATNKVATLSDTEGLATGNRYLYRVVSAEELPPVTVLPEPHTTYPYTPLAGQGWRGTSRRSR